MRILLTGAGATLCMDLWALLLKRRFGIPSLDYALVGRWFLGMFDGRWFHATIVTAPRAERTIGWILHYAVGIAFAFIPIGLAGIGWYTAPEPLIALLSGWLSLAAPFLVMQPALGFGVAAAKPPTRESAAPQPAHPHGVWAGPADRRPAVGGAVRLERAYSSVEISR